MPNYMAHDEMRSRIFRNTYVRLLHDTDDHVDYELEALPKATKAETWRLRCALLGS